jgi:hypothetical protein
MSPGWSEPGLRESLKAIVHVESTVLADNLAISQKSSSVFLSHAWRKDPWLSVRPQPIGSGELLIN